MSWAIRHAVHWLRSPAARIPYGLAVSLASVVDLAEGTRRGLSNGAVVAALSSHGDGRPDGPNRTRTSMFSVPASRFSVNVVSSVGPP